MKINSLQKAIDIIEAIERNSTHSSGVSIANLSKITDLPRSTIHHILSTFKENGYVAQDLDNKKYSLGYKFLTMSRRVLDNINIRQIAHNDLVDLSTFSKEAAFLSIMRGDKVVFIDKVQLDGTKIPLATDIGFTSEPHASSSGKVLLSAMSNDQICSIYPDEELPVFAPRTIRTKTELVQHIEQVRERGYAIDDEEYYRGIRCIAAPIRSGDQIVAAISITGSVFSITLDNITNILLPKLMEKALIISNKLNNR